MAFVPRSFETILTDMVAHVRANTTLTDFTVGSIIRTILEASAIEDDEQYYQMVQLLADFSFNTASGADLDKRAADFNITRLEAGPSVGDGRYTNEALIKSTLQFNTPSGSTAIIVQDSSRFPIPSPSYTLRIGEGTAQVEDVVATVNNTALNKFTISALVNTHVVDEMVSFVSGTDISVPSGIQVQVPAQGDSGPIVYSSIEPATLVAGNYFSSICVIKAVDDGSFGNVGAGQISQFSGGFPFPGAGFTNPTNTNGGRDRETDREFRDRIRLKIQFLARATPIAIEGAVKGLVDPVSGKKVVSAKLLESFTDLEHKLYIDDGTGFMPSSVTMGRSTVVDNPLSIGSSAVQVVTASKFPASGYVLISPEDPDQTEVLHYSSKNMVSNTINLASSTTKLHNKDDEVLLVDYLGTAELGQNYFQLSQYPLKKHTLELYDDSTGTGKFRLRTEGTDFLINRTNGQIEYYGSGLPSGAKVYANYSYYTGMLALAQKVINGDRNDPTNYPGSAAGGVIIYVSVPTIRSINVLASISVDAGYDEDTLKSKVKTSIENYIDGLSIGDNVILSRMVERSFFVPGVSNVIIKSPTTDIVILEDELPKSYDSSGNSLVKVI